MNLDIAAMQLFNGVSLFSILLLMAIGLAVVFGLMGVINMAHGELMAMGAYITYLVSLGFHRWAPGWMDVYLFAAIPLAFAATFAFGYMLERGFIRWFYNRPLDTLLATWGLSLILQQAYRSLFGAQEVSVPLASWLSGAWEPTPDLQFPLNRIFILGLTLLVSIAVYLLLYRSAWGLRVRAVTQNRAMAGAVGINTRRVDAMTFALGSGLAGIAGCVFTMIGSTNPGTGQLYIVDSFIVVVFGGVQSLLGTAFSGFAIAQSQTTFEYLMSGSMAKVTILVLVIVVLYFRPNGLFASKTRGEAMKAIYRRTEVISIALVALAVLLVLPLALDPFRLNLVGKYMAFAFVAIGIVLTWGYSGVLSLGQGIFFGLGGYMMAMFLKLEASAPELPDFMVWSSVDSLPAWWQPFHSLGWTVALILVLPGAAAYLFSYAIFRKRVGGVYFAIVTLALAMTLTVLIIGQQGDTGGANGITDFRTLLGMDIVGDEGKRALYLVEAACLTLCMLAALAVVRSRVGKILIAIRDREDRVRFSGYDTAHVKACVFSAVAVLSSIGGPSSPCRWA